MNVRRIRLKQMLTLVMLMMAAGLAACNSSDDGGGASGPGAVSVSLTDAPACGFDAVNVTVSKVRIHQSDSANDNASGWTDITLNPPRKINLLDLNDPTQPNLALEHLGESPLPSGHYTQLRLLLVGNNGNNPLANSIVLSGTTTEIPLDTPSGIQTGIKLVHQFDVPPGQRVDLLLDFDACKSVVKRGNGTYALKPVIKVSPIVLNGIEGFVDKALLGSHVVVTAQTNGDIVRSTVPNSVSGKFFLARLAAPANYDVVLTADNRAAAVISNVPVQSATSITPISTEQAPITLLSSPTQRTVSGIVVLNPPVDDESVLLEARQSLTSGPTVKWDTATVIPNNPTGDYSYSLTLPTAPPTLGTYSASLPITLTQQPAAVGGKYALRASTEGYSSQSANVDVSVNNATQNFTLVP